MTVLRQIISTGRGGRGNIRSPSRDPVYWGRITVSDAHDRTHNHHRHHHHHYHYSQQTGRGGVGNFRPPSCDRSVNGPEDYLDTRGRDGVLESDRNAVRTFFPLPLPRPCCDGFASGHFHWTWREWKHSLAFARPRHRQSRRVSRAISQPWTHL